MFEYKLSNSTRVGLLSELKSKGFMWGSHNEQGNYTEHIPSMWEQASVTPFGCTAVYLEKLPKIVDGELVEESKWHVDVISPIEIAFNESMIVTDIATPYNSMQ